MAHAASPFFTSSENRPWSEEWRPPTCRAMRCSSMSPLFRSSPPLGEPRRSNSSCRCDCAVAALKTASPTTDWDGMGDFIRVLLTLVLAAGLEVLGPHPSAEAAPGGELVFFGAVGETWTICRGANAPDHGTEFDFTTQSGPHGGNGCTGDGNHAKDKLVYAPVTGHVSSVDVARGGVCIQRRDGAGAAYLGHLYSRPVVGTEVFAGVTPVGKVAGANEHNVANGNYAHVHFYASNHPTCDGPVALTGQHAFQCNPALPATASYNGHQDEQFVRCESMLRDSSTGAIYAVADGNRLLYLPNMTSVNAVGGGWMNVAHSFISARTTIGFGALVKGKSSSQVWTLGERVQGAGPGLLHVGPQGFAQRGGDSALVTVPDGALAGYATASMFVADGDPRVLASHPPLLPFHAIHLLNGPAVVRHGGWRLVYRFAAGSAADYVVDASER